MKKGYRGLDTPMNVDDLSVFLAIVQCGSLTAAAKSLYISQPALSKRLSRFEAELGSPLFERGQGAHRMQLTPAGKMLVPFAEKWGKLQEEMSLLHDLNSRTHFFISCVGTVGEHILTDAVYRFTLAQPETEVVIRRYHSRECYGSIHDHTADIGFVVSKQFFQNILTTPLFQEQMVLVVSEDSEWRAPVDPQSLPPQREILIPWSPEYLRWRQNRLDFAHQPHITLWGLPLAVPFMQKQGCWTIAPLTVAQTVLQAHPGLRQLPLLNAPPERITYWIEEYGRHHPDSDILLGILRDHLARKEGLTWLYSL